MTKTEFYASSEFTIAEKLIVSYMLQFTNTVFDLSLRELTKLLSISYATAQKSMKNLTKNNVLSSSRLPDNSPTIYCILLD